MRHSFRSVVAGLAVGVLAFSFGAELACFAASGGAFPHVNFYVPDPELGVRLKPDQASRISFSGNPVTRINSNNEGYRGSDWPEPTVPEVLVVGDSQVFGLGVEEDQVAASRLSRILGRPVINGRVGGQAPA